MSVPAPRLVFRQSDVPWRIPSADVDLTSVPRRALDARVRSIRNRQHVARGPDVYELNDVAAEIWRRCDGTVTAAEIARALDTLYDVELRRAEADVVALIEELVGLGLVELVHPAAPRAT